MERTFSSADKRQSLIEAAHRLFRRNGFHATGIDRIIAEAGVAKMTLYRHFRAKDDLIVAVLDWRAARFAERLDRSLASARTPAARLDALLDWYERWFEGADFQGCLFQHALAEFGDTESPVREAALRQKRALQLRLRALLAEDLPEEHAANGARTLLVLIEGATVLARMGEGGAALASARAVAASLLAPSPDGPFEAAP